MPSPSLQMGRESSRVYYYLAGPLAGSEPWQESDIEIVDGSPQIIELEAVVRSFSKFACPFNLSTNSAYVAGILQRDENSFIKAVSNAHICYKLSTPLPEQSQKLKTVNPRGEKRIQRNKGIGICERFNTYLEDTFVRDQACSSKQTETLNSMRTLDHNTDWEEKKGKNPAIPVRMDPPALPAREADKAAFPSPWCPSGKQRRHKENPVHSIAGITAGTIRWGEQRKQGTDGGGGMGRRCAGCEKEKDGCRKYNMLGGLRASPVSPAKAGKALLALVTQYLRVRILLEEKESMLQKCLEEHGNLAAEWAEFHNQERLMEECLEHKMEQSQKTDFTIKRLAEVSELLPVASSTTWKARRMGPSTGETFSAASRYKVRDIFQGQQTDLKLYGQKLRAKEEQLERDKEHLDESWQELHLKKEKLKKAKQHIQQREKELKSMTEQSIASVLQFTDRMYPQHSLWGSRAKRASSIAFDAMIQMLKHKAQIVFRCWILMTMTVKQGGVKAAVGQLAAHVGALPFPRSAASACDLRAPAMGRRVRQHSPGSARCPLCALGLPGLCSDSRASAPLLSPARVEVEGEIKWTLLINNTDLSPLFSLQTSLDHDHVTAATRCYSTPTDIYKNLLIMLELDIMSVNMWIGRQSKANKCEILSPHSRYQDPLIRHSSVSCTVSGTQSITQSQLPPRGVDHPNWVRSNFKVVNEDISDCIREQNGNGGVWLCVTVALCDAVAITGRGHCDAGPCPDSEGI
ncbi:hypothetical protein DV515_00011189 [Chloebia gouldiae]|uniref:Uncharacterized protein n=1 Tax=Chloebia gouldiae TaxID=44316 RepID=A0A3L8S8D2_CHLGU|nr:hypothetical protein DV515_00011189 [Chloebia gouldiae]